MSNPRTPKPLSPEARDKIREEDALRVLRKIAREQNAGQPATASLPKASKSHREAGRLPADKLQAEYDKAKFEKARAKLFEYWSDAD